jgi:hypothetical protein
MEYGKDPYKDGEEKWKITCAGMPVSCYEHVNIDNFDIDSSYEGKLQQKRVSGGIVLNNTTFTIKK